MARIIASQDPTVVPAQAEETFGNMEVSRFKVQKSGSGLSLRCSLQKVDAEGDALAGEEYHMSIKNLENQMAVTPKFANAWDTIVDVMGLAYDFYRLRDKVEEAMGRGEDTTELIAARDAALQAMRADV